MVKSHLKLWIIGFFLAMLAVPALMPPEAAKGRLRAEYESSAAIFGTKRVDAIGVRATFLYDAIIGGSGLDALIHNGFVEKSATDRLVIAKAGNETMATKTNRYLQSMLLQLYGVFFRGSLMLQWLPYIGFFLIAAIGDGITQRRIRNDELQMNSPIKFAVSLHAAIVIVLSPIAYLMLPASVTPWFMPIWAALIAIPLSKVIAHAAKTG